MRPDSLRAVGECALPRVEPFGGAFPLRFGRQSGPRPAGKRVGFVVADVADGLCRIDRSIRPSRPNWSAHSPSSDPTPVERRLDRVLPHPGPAVRQPEADVPIPAVIDERAPLAIRDKTAGEHVRLNPLRMAGTLAIEREAGAVMPDLDWALSALHPTHRRRRVGAWGASGFPDCRRKRVLRKQVEDVREK